MSNSFYFEEFQNIEATSSNITEQALIAQLQRKEISALDLLYSRYSSALFGVVKRILKHDDIAEEVLQDAFLRIWERIDSYNSEKGRLFTWMLNVTRNLAIDKMRSGEISRELKTSGIEKLVSKVESTDVNEQAVDTIGLPESLTQLPPDQKFVVEHLYLKGYTQSELAEEFDIPLGTVKTRLRLAMVQLRTIYDVK